MTQRTCLHRLAHRLPALLLLLVVAVHAGCDAGPGASLYDPDDVDAPAPVLSRLEPADAALAGVGTVTLHGENFATEPSRNLVYFNNTRAQVLEATPTRLVVKSPNLPQDGIRVKVAVLEAERYSNVLTYALRPVALPFANIKSFEVPSALTTDAAGNLFFSLFSSGVSAGIKQVSPAGVRTDYTATPFRWEALELGPDGYLYGVRNLRAIFRFPAGGGTQETWAVAPNSAVRFTALDVLEDGMVWAGGAGGSLYRVSPDRTLQAFPFEPTVQALAVFDGALYAAGGTGTDSRIYRFPLRPDGTLGAAEVYYDVAANHAGAQALSLAFAASGELFVGTTSRTPVLIIQPDRSAAPLYEDVLRTPSGITASAEELAWGPDGFLYVLRRNVRQSGAAEIVSFEILRVDTGREGAR